MLEVGNGLTDTESRAHFSLWALLNAPLLAGNDLRSMSAATRTILTNTEVIAVNQDWGGRQGNKLSDNGDPRSGTRRCRTARWRSVLLNRAQSPATISTTAAALGLASSSAYTVKNLWTNVVRASGLGARSCAGGVA